MSDLEMAVVGLYQFGSITAVRFCATYCFLNHKKSD